MFCYEVIPLARLSFCLGTRRKSVYFHYLNVLLLILIQKFMILQ